MKKLIANLAENARLFFEDPRKYMGWAGCTREMIRAAPSRRVTRTADR